MHFVFDIWIVLTSILIQMILSNWFTHIGVAHIPNVFTLSRNSNCGDAWGDCSSGGGDGGCVVVVVVLVVDSQWRLERVPPVDWSTRPLLRAACGWVMPSFLAFVGHYVSLRDRSRFPQSWRRLRQLRRSLRLAPLRRRRHYRPVGACTIFFNHFFHSLFYSFFFSISVYIGARELGETVGWGMEREHPRQDVPVALSRSVLWINQSPFRLQRTHQRCLAVHLPQQRGWWSANTGHVPHLRQTSMLAGTADPLTTKITIQRILSIGQHIILKLSRKIHKIFITRINHDMNRNETYIYIY